MPSPLEISLNQILCLAREQHFRGCLVLSGSQVWCQQQALDAIALINDDSTVNDDSNVNDSSNHKPFTYASQICWVGDSAPESDHIHAIPSHAVTQLLGSDTDCLVIDAWSGLAPNMLGMASGTLRGGALLLLLTPPLDEWPTYNDPDYQRYSALRPDPYSMSGHFLQRTASLLASAERNSLAANKPWLSIVKQGDNFDAPVGASANDCANDCANDKDSEKSSITAPSLDNKNIEPFIPSREQLLVIDAVDKLSLQESGVVVLNADRGRGKSVALGLAAKYLLAQPHFRIVVVAPLRSQVSHLFAALGDVTDNSNITFMAVDQLIIASGDKDNHRNSDQAICDLLIVDEAAAIPLPILYQLFSVAPRIVFSSTLHGYEGSGKGFSLRFKEYLQAQDKPLQLLTLIEPIRWSSGDPLETFFNQLLILNTNSDAGVDAADAADADNNNRPGISALSIRIRMVSNNELLANEKLLRELFTLLVEAHYQTRPADLRQLLDVPYLHLWVAECSSSAKVVGVLLAYKEGGFSHSHDELLEHIVSGKRRPQGNLLSQTLTNQTADTQWCRLKSLRVSRIAVAESYRRQGVASDLLKKLELFAVSEGCDFWGSSFGFEPHLLSFWQSHKALPVYLGLHRDKASGLRNLMVVKPLTDKLKLMSNDLHQQLLLDLPFWQAQYFSDMSTDTLMSLSNDHPKQVIEPLDKGLDKGYDQQRIQRFIDAELTYDKVFPSLYRMLVSAQSVLMLSELSAVGSVPEGGIEGDIESDIESYIESDSKHALKSANTCPVTQASLLLAPNWGALAKQFQLKGRREVITAIKTELIQLSMD